MANDFENGQKQMRQKDINEHATFISNPGKMCKLQRKFASVTSTVGLRRTNIIARSFSVNQTIIMPLISKTKYCICANTFLKNYY